MKNGFRACDLYNLRGKRTSWSERSLLEASSNVKVGSTFSRKFQRSMYCTSSSSINSLKQIKIHAQLQSCIGVRAGREELWSGEREGEQRTYMRERELARSPREGLHFLAVSYVFETPALTTTMPSMLNYRSMP